MFFESFGFAAASSLHCAFMCGPLTLLFPGSRTAVLAYQGSRVFAYTLVGVALGAIGTGVGSSHIGHAAFSFALAGLVLLLACGIDKRIGRLPGAGRITTRLMQRVQGTSVGTRSLLLGLSTPLLPCGLLFAGWTAALVSGDALSGGLAMLGFGLGTVPMLVVAQVQGGWIRSKLGPARLQILSRAAMVLAGGVLAWRGAAHLGGGSCCG